MADNEEVDIRELADEVVEDLDTVLKQYPSDFPAEAVMVALTELIGGLLAVAPDEVQESYRIRVFDMINDNYWSLLQARKENEEAQEAH